MREEVIEEGKKTKFLQCKSQHQCSCTALKERKPQCLVAIEYAKGNESRGNSRAADYILALTHLPRCPRATRRPTSNIHTTYIM
jgi:hypothetical protein